MGSALLIRLQQTSFPSPPQISAPELTQAPAPAGGGIYASYAWAPPCDALRGRGALYDYAGPARLGTYGVCFVADDLTRGPALGRPKSLPLCLALPLLKCSTPALTLARAAGYEGDAGGGGGGGEGVGGGGGDGAGGGGYYFALSAYGVLRLSFEAADDADATAALAPAVWIAAGVGGVGGASVAVANATCLAAGGGGGGGCSALAFAVSLAGRPADAGRNRTVCATVTNDQARRPVCVYVRPHGCMRL